MDEESIESRLKDLAAEVRLSHADDTRERGRLGKYRIDALIGSGGQSVALRAWDTDLHRDVVLKVQHKTETEEQRDRVVEEGRALARVQSPFVARCHTVETFANKPCLVLEHVPGENLGFRSQYHLFTPERAAAIISQIAEGLDAIHARGIVHRDIKPDNIVLTPGGVPKIIDFGLASIGATSVTDSSGTAVYMPPERARGESGGDVRGDVFGLGAVLFEMLTGKPPFAAETKEAALEKARAGVVSEPLPDPTHPLARVCLRCLSQEPKARFATAMDVATAARNTIPKPAGRRLGLVVVAVVAAACLLAIGSRFYGGSEPQTVDPDQGMDVVSEEPPAKVDAATSPPVTIWVDGALVRVQNEEFGDGSKESPFLTITEAVNAAHANDTIRIRGWALVDGKRVRTRYRETWPIEIRMPLTITDWDHEDSGGLAALSDFLPTLRGVTPLPPEHQHLRDKMLATSEKSRPFFVVSAGDVSLTNLRFAGASGNAIEIQNVDRQIKNVTIDNCGFYRTLGATILASGVEGLTLRRIRSSFCGYRPGIAAIYLDRCVRVHIGRVDVNNLPAPIDEEVGQTGPGLSLVACQYVEVSRSAFRNLRYSEGVRVVDGVEIRLKKNLISTCDVGINVTGQMVRNFDASENVIGCCQKSGIVVGPSVKGAVPASTLLAHEIYIDGNTIYSSGLNGIHVSPSEITTFHVCGNVCLDSGQLDLDLSPESITGAKHDKLFLTNNVFGYGTGSTPRSIRASRCKVPDVVSEQLKLRNKFADKSPQLRAQSDRSDGGTFQPDLLSSYAPTENARAIDYAHSWRALPNSVDIGGTDRLLQPDAGALEFVLDVTQLHAQPFEERGDWPGSALATQPPGNSPAK